MIRFKKAGAGVVPPNAAPLVLTEFPTMYQVPFSVKGNWYTSDNIPEMAKVIESLRKGDNIRVWGQVAHARVRKHSIHTIIAHKIKIFQRHEYRE